MKLVYRGLTYTSPPAHPSATAAQPLNPALQLVYRGLTYTPQASAPEAPNRNIQGQYRGAPLTFKAATPQPQPTAIATLQYRGVRYMRVR